jgi:hypothetical protein
MKSFTTKIFIIGINPYILLPESVLQSLFKQSGKDKGAIAVRGTLNGKDFTQTLVKYSGKWRLYLNTPMRKAAGIDVGDIAKVKIEFDPEPRIIPMHPGFYKGWRKIKKQRLHLKNLLPHAKKNNALHWFFENRRVSDNNIKKVSQHLSGKGSFIGKD